MGNGRQNHKFSSPKIEAVYFCIVLVLMEILAGRNQEGMRLFGVALSMVRHLGDFYVTYKKTEGLSDNSRSTEP